MYARCCNDPLCKHRPRRTGLSPRRPRKLLLQPRDRLSERVHLAVAVQRPRRVGPIARDDGVARRRDALLDAVAPLAVALNLAPDRVELLLQRRRAQRRLLALALGVLPLERRRELALDRLLVRFQLVDLRRDARADVRVEIGLPPGRRRVGRRVG